MNLLAILSNIGISDILDILFISFVAYQLYVWFSGTKAFKALIGILVLSGIYIIAESWGLFLTTWVFQILWQVFVILLIILFQREIRQMLERFNPLRKFGYRHSDAHEQWVSSFCDWIFDAAKKKMGVLIVFERNDLIFDLITKGVAMEGDPVPEILNSIFIKESPLHDGASVISKGKLLKTSCFLPLTIQEDLPKEWGTRHRAAMGLTEQSDAAVLIVSEERGEVSIAIKQEMTKITEKAVLAEWLRKEALSTNGSAHDDVLGRIKSWFTVRYPLKLAVLISVFVLWLLLAGQQNYEKRIPLPVDFNQLPSELVLSESGDSTVYVTCRGLRKDVSLLDRNNVKLVVNLSGARAGTWWYPVSSDNLALPNDRVHVMEISPSRVEVTLNPAGHAGDPPDNETHP